MAVPASMAYRKMLMDIGSLLSERELNNMKYFCREFIPRGRLEEIEQPMDLWDALEERDKLSATNTDFLKALLTSGTEGRTDLPQILQKYENWRVPRASLHTDAANIHCARTQNHQFTGPTYNELRREIDFVVKSIGREWRSFLRELGVSEADMDYLTEAFPRDMREKVRQGMLLWQKDSLGQASKEGILTALRRISRNDLVYAISSGNY